MATNSGIKHESETMMEVIRGLVLDLLLYFPFQSTLDM